MILRVIVDETVHELRVPDGFATQAADFFEQLDRDMDRGWQMGRFWVESPERMQRCQIVADKLLTALENHNQRLGTLMAGYLLARLPGLESVEPDVQGEIQNTRFTITAPQVASAAPLPAASAQVAREVEAAPAGLSKLEAMERAGREVSPVFRVGRGWRFSILDPERGDWIDAPLAASEQEAARLRQAAVKTRYEALLGVH